MKENRSYPGKVILTMDEYMSLIDDINKAQRDAELHLLAFTSTRDELAKLKEEIANGMGRV